MKKDDDSSVMTKASKTAMYSQCIGFGLDSYDMALLIVMAPILKNVFASPGQTGAWQYLQVVLFCSIAMAARPLGSAIFGHYADKIGRRNLLMYTISGVGVMSVLSALVPTKEMVGIVASYLTFGIIRLFMGIFFGGEYACGHAFAIEHAPKARRGFISGFIQSGFAIGYAIASIVVLGFSLWLGEKAMQDYGWRLVFATGAAPVLFALWIRKSLAESPEFEKIKRKGSVAKAPFASLFKPPTLWVFLQVSVLMTGFFLSSYSIYEFLPSILKGKDKFGLVDYTIIYSVALFISAICYIFFGWLTDKLGRKKLTQWSFVIIAALGIPLYKLIIYAAVSRNFKLALLAGVAVGMFKINWAVIPAYLSERFPTKNRSVGVGFGYSVGALLGGAGITALVAIIHSQSVIAAIEGPNELWLSASITLTIGAVMSFLSLSLGPETKNLELSEIGEELKLTDGKEPVISVVTEG